MSKINWIILCYCLSTYVLHVQMHKKHCEDNSQPAGHRCILLTCKFPDEIVVRCECDNTGNCLQPRNCWAHPILRHA